jgi:hypothetical protein
VIERGINNKKFRDIDPEKTAFVFLGLIWTILKHGIVIEDEDVEKKYFDVIFELVFHGLLLK